MSLFLFCFHQIIIEHLLTEINIVPSLLKLTIQWITKNHNCPCLFLSSNNSYEGRVCSSLKDCNKKCLLELSQQNAWLGWWHNQQTFICSQLWGGRSDIRVSAELVSGESSISGSQTAAFLLCSHMQMGRGGRECSGKLGVSLLIGKLSPSWGPHPHDLIWS